MKAEKGLTIRRKKSKKLNKKREKWKELSAKSKTTKVCKDCTISKLESLFPFESNRCKECTNKIQNKNNKKRMEKAQTSNEEKECKYCNKRKKISLFHEACGNQCIDCRNERRKPQDKESANKRKANAKVTISKKKCSTCKIEKNSTEFCIQTDTNDSLRSRCNKCEKSSRDIMSNFVRELRMKSKCPCGYGGNDKWMAMDFAHYDRKR